MRVYHVTALFIIAAAVLMACAAPSAGDLQERYDEQEGRHQIYVRFWAYGPSPNCDEDKLNDLEVRLNVQGMAFARPRSRFELFMQAGDEGRKEAALILDERDAVLDEIKSLLQEADCEIPF